MEEIAKPRTAVDKAETFVSKVIASCEDTFHIQCAKKLLDHFKETYGKKHGGKIAYERLQTELVNKVPMLINLD